MTFLIVGFIHLHGDANTSFTDKFDSAIIFNRYS